MLVGEHVHPINALMINPTKTLITPPFPSLLLMNTAAAPSALTPTLSPAGRGRRVGYGRRQLYCTSGTQVVPNFTNSHGPSVAMTGAPLPGRVMT